MSTDCLTRLCFCVTEYESLEPAPAPTEVSDFSGRRIKPLALRDEMLCPIQELSLCSLTAGLNEAVERKEVAPLFCRRLT